ncbi:MAG: acyl-CoA dehydrogenase family protein [Myxococcota bacterium]
MDFGLSEEQDMLQETIRGFAQNECPTTRLRELFDAGDGHDPKLWEGLCEMGVAGLTVPEEFGGAGMEMLDLALVAEVLGEFAVPGPFLGHAMATLGVQLCGDAAQQKAILPGLAGGEKLATIAIQEDETHFAPGDWTLKADGGRISGKKTIVSHANLADAFLVGLAGGKLAWVDAKAEGIKIEDANGIDRTRPIFSVTFDGTPAEILSDPEGQVERLNQAGSILLAADTFGAATKLIDLDVAYSLSREQFGQPIAQFQAIKHTIARLATDIEPSRALYWYAAHAFDHIRDDSARSASVTKAHITDRAMHAARESVELHGGYGFTWECEVQMWFKRIMFNRSFLGTPEQHRESAAQLGGW